MSFHPEEDAEGAELWQNSFAERKKKNKLILLILVGYGFLLTMFDTTLMVGVLGIWLLLMVVTYVCKMNESFVLHHAQDLANTYGGYIICAALCMG